MSQLPLGGQTALFRLHLVLRCDFTSCATGIVCTRRGTQAYMVQSQSSLSVSIWEQLSTILHRVCRQPTLGNLVVASDLPFASTYNGTVLVQEAVVDLGWGKMFIRIVMGVGHEIVSFARAQVLIPRDRTPPRRDFVGNLS